MTLPSTPTQSPRSTSLPKRANASAPSSPWLTNSWSSPLPSRTFAKINLPCVRFNNTRPATRTTSSVDEPASMRSSQCSRTSRSECVRSNRTGYGSSPRARISSTFASRALNSSSTTAPSLRYALRRGSAASARSLWLPRCATPYGVAPLRPHGHLAIPIEDDPQPVQREPRFVMLHGTRVGDDRLGQSAGGDHLARSELGDEAVDEAVDLRAEAVDHARLDRLRRRLPDDVLRLHELDPAQSGGAPEERGHPELGARGDRTTE